jgi:hypothetical protein
MPTVFTAKLDGSAAVRYFPISLAVFHLRHAFLHATAAQRATEGEPKFKEALLSIVFASLCLEAFANEMAEETLKPDELEDFFWLRRQFRSKVRAPSVVSKIRLLFERRWSAKLSLQASPLKELGELFDLRNLLVHYRLTESAAKTYLPRGSIRTESDGASVTQIDLTTQPTRVEPSLVEKVNERRAADSYNAALRVLKAWNGYAGAPADALSSFSECVIS